MEVTETNVQKYETSLYFLWHVGLRKVLEKLSPFIIAWDKFAKTFKAYTVY